jgi:4-hydroxy-tetrahydrodipicolinate synthase
VTAELRRRLEHRVIPAVPVPFGENHQIDGAAQATYVQWMAAQPVGAVAIWAHTGRGLLLSDEQRALVLAAWREGLGDVPVLCGVGVPKDTHLPSASKARTDAVIEATVRLAEDARRGGADGVLVHPPTVLRGLRDVHPRVIALHQAVADAGLPVIAFYLYERAGGVSYQPKTVELLLEIEGVMGLKVATLDSVMTFQELVPVMARRPESLVITGEDRFLGYSLMLGARAALVGMAAACTHASAALLDAWFHRDLTAFVRRAAALDAFAQATFVDPMEGYVQRMLWALAADGVIPPRRDPFAPPLGQGERERVAKAVRALHGS